MRSNLRRRRSVLIVLLILALILGWTTAISIAQPPGDDRSDSVGTPLPGGSGSLPANVAVVTRGGHGEGPALQLLSTADGSLVRELVAPGDLRAPLGVTLSPDQKTVYYVDAEAGGPRINKVAATGGAREVVVLSGRQPSLSPDGMRLAYVDGADVVVRSLDSGVEARKPAGNLPAPATGRSPMGTRALTWLDNERVAALLGGPGDAYFVAVYDTTTSSPLDVRSIVPSPPGQVITAGSNPSEVVVSQDMENAPAQISVVNISGTVPPRTVKDLSADRTVFDVSRGGGFVLASEQGGLYLEALAGGTPVRLTDMVRDAAF